MKTLKESVIEQIKNMSSSELVYLNNTYCSEAGYDDSEIYNNDEEFFDMFFEGKPIEVARATFYGDYNYSHDYVKFNGYGNLESLSSIATDDLADSVEVIAEYAIENQREFDMLDFELDEEGTDETE